MSTTITIKEQLQVLIATYMSDNKTSDTSKLIFHLDQRNKFEYLEFLEQDFEKKRYYFEGIPAVFVSHNEGDLPALVVKNEYDYLAEKDLVNITTLRLGDKVEFKNVTVTVVKPVRKSILGRRFSLFTVETPTGATFSYRTGINVYYDEERKIYICPLTLNV